MVMATKRFLRYLPASLLLLPEFEVADSYQAVAEKLSLPINEVKEDSRKLLQDTYVDNGTNGGSRTQVQRMLGTRLKDGTYSGTIPAMLKQVGLKIKTIVSSVSQDPEDLAMLSDKVLGCLYNPKEDLLGIKFVFNPSKKKKGLKTKLDLNLQHIDSFYESPQSKGSNSSSRSIKKFSTISLSHGSDLIFTAVVHTDTKQKKTIMRFFIMVILMTTTLPTVSKHLNKF